MAGHDAGQRSLLSYHSTPEHAALAMGRTAVADSLLARADRFCNPCDGYYRAEATMARRLGDSTAALHLLAHARGLAQP